MANTYDIGDVVRLTATFTDTGGTAADPSSVKFYYEDPSGNFSTETSTGNIVNSAVGTYYVDLTLDESGVWEYRVSSTGTIQASEEGYFVARARRVP